MSGSPEAMPLKYYAMLFDTFVITLTANYYISRTLPVLLITNRREIASLSQEYIYFFYFLKKLTKSAINYKPLLPLQALHPEYHFHTAPNLRLSLERERF